MFQAKYQVDVASFALKIASGAWEGGGGRFRNVGISHVLEALFPSVEIILESVLRPRRSTSLLVVALLDGTVPSALLDGSAPSAPMDGALT